MLANSMYPQYARPPQAGNPLGNPPAGWPAGAQGGAPQPQTMNPWGNNVQPGTAPGTMPPQAMGGNAPLMQNRGPQMRPGPAAPNAPWAGASMPIGAGNIGGAMRPFPGPGRGMPPAISPGNPGGSPFVQTGMPMASAVNSNIMPGNNGMPSGFQPAVMQAPPASIW